MIRHRLTYNIGEVAPYINWAYYYFAWQVRDVAEQVRLRREATQILSSLDGHYRVKALFALGDANADGDDIVFEGTRIPMLRQQEPAVAGGPCLSLADFIRPISSGQCDRMGLFATTVDIGLETDFVADDYRKMVVQLLADRLAEAAAELMHLQVRTDYWGYAPDERLRPHASVSGLMISHPAARYFSVGRIGSDQLRDYARRRGVPVGLMRRFLCSNIE